MQTALELFSPSYVDFFLCFSCALGFCISDFYNNPCLEDFFKQNMRNVQDLHSSSSACVTSQLKISHPNHVLVERASAGEAAFERAVQSVA